MLQNVVPKPTEDLFSKEHHRLEAIAPLFSGSISGDVFDANVRMLVRTRMVLSSQEERSAFHALLVEDD